MLYVAITTALDGRTAPIAGRDVAEVAGIAYKAAIDALGRMLDAGTVVRYGAQALLEMGAVEAAWRTRPAAPSPPRGGGRSLLA